MKKYIFVYLLILNVSNSVAQDFHFGPMIGYGRYYLDDYYENVDYGNFIGNGGNKCSISLYVDFKPEKPIFNFNSGVVFESFFFNEFDLLFIKFPFGLDFLLGTKNQCVLGINFFLKTNVFKSEKYDQYEFCNETLFGVTPSIGYCYKYDDIHSLVIKLQREMYFIPLCGKTVQAINHPPGHYISNSYKLYDLIISIGIKYRL